MINYNYVCKDVNGFYCDDNNVNIMMVTLRPNFQSKKHHAGLVNEFNVTTLIIFCTLQYYNAWIINQAYLKLNNCGGGNIHRDLELDNIF